MFSKTNTFTFLVANLHFLWILNSLTPLPKCYSVHERVNFALYRTQQQQIIKIIDFFCENKSIFLKNCVCLFTQECAHLFKTINFLV